jgi:hypothetical protein
MTVEIFFHQTGHLAVQATATTGETYSSLNRLLATVPSRRWHPYERLWTLDPSGLGSPTFFDRLLELKGCNLAIDYDAWEILEDILPPQNTTSNHPTHRQLLTESANSVLCDTHRRIAESRQARRKRG